MGNTSPLLLNFSGLYKMVKKWKSSKSQLLMEGKQGQGEKSFQIFLSLYLKSILPQEALIDLAGLDFFSS